MSTSNLSTLGVVSMTAEDPWLSTEAGESPPPSLHFTPTVKPGYIWIFILSSAWSLLGTGANVLTLLAFLRYPKLRKPTNLLLANLAVCDLLSSLATPVFSFSSFTRPGVELAQRSRAACLWALWAIVASLWSSLLSVLIISLERLVSVLAPLKHLSWMTTRTARGMIAVVWVTLALSTAPPLLGWNTWHKEQPCFAIYAHPEVYLMTFHTTLPLVIMVLLAVVSFTIALVAYRSNRQLQQQQGPTTSSSSSCCPEMSIHIKRKVKQFKVTKMLLCVIGVFYLTWLPYMLLTTLITLLYPQPQDEPRLVTILHKLSKAFLLTGFVLNPVIYARQNSRFRQAFHDITHCK